MTKYRKCPKCKASHQHDVIICPACGERIPAARRRPSRLPLLHWIEDKAAPAKNGDNTEEGWEPK